MNKAYFLQLEKKVAEKINKIWKTNELENMDEYIVLCSPDDKQGILGNFKLALDNYDEEIGKS